MLSLTIKEVIHRVQRKETSVKEICDLCFRRIRKLQKLNAFTKDTSSSITESEINNAQLKYDQNGPLGALEGLPVAVKDNFSTTGVQTSCASQMLVGYEPPYTATVVRRLQENGGFVVGKANMDEFAMGCGSTDGCFGPVRNPWKYPWDKNNPHSPADFAKDFHIAGGSSGGSAVAVATGMAYCSLGSDTGGSTRNPASFCGVVGLKPTYGRLSRHGLIPLVNSLDVPGIVTRSVDDAAHVLNILSGHDPLDSTTVTDKHDPVILSEGKVSLKGLHIGIPKEYHAPGLSKDNTAIWEQATSLLEAAGAKVSSVSLPHTQYSIACYSVLCACEVASNMARYDGIEFGLRAGDESSTENLYAKSRHEGFNDVVRGRILAGNYFLLKRNYDKYFLQAQRLRRLIADDFTKVFQSGVDALLTPTVLGDAPLYSEFSQADNRTRTQEQDVLTQPTNLAGIPAITIPSSLSSNGLPIGLQVMTSHFEEQKLLTVAKCLEQQFNFPYLNLDWLDS